MKQQAKNKDLETENARLRKQLQRYVDGCMKLNRGFRYMCVAFNGSTPSCPQVKFMSGNTLDAAFAEIPAIQRAAAVVKAREEAARAE